MTKILPEMIPDAAVTALEEAFAGGPVCTVDFRIALANVLNAWGSKVDRYNGATLIGLNLVAKEPENND